MLAAAAGLALLELTLETAGLFEAPPVLEATPVFVAPVLLTLPAAGFAVAAASVEDAVASPFAEPAVMMTGRKEISPPLKVVLTTLGTVSISSVMEDCISFAPVCEAVQVALVDPSRMQSTVAVTGSKVYVTRAVQGPCVRVNALGPIWQP